MIIKSLLRSTILSEVSSPINSLLGSKKQSADIGVGDLFFATDGSTYPMYVATTPVGFYDSVGNKTWTIYEGWDGQDRVEYVQVFDHSNNTWSPSYVAGRSVTHNDDHGVPSMVMDHQGYVHIFFGPHNSLLRYSYTTNPRDPTSWESTGGLDWATTYPHPQVINGKLILTSRYLESSGNHSTGAIKVTTALNNGIATWGAVRKFGDFGTDSRYYFGAQVNYNNKVYIISTRANFNDDYRRDIYILVYDPVTDSMSNIDGSYTVAAASWPIDLNTHNTYFKVYSHDVSAPADSDKYSGNIPSMCIDSSGNIHILVFNGKTTGVGYYGGGFADIDVLHMMWNGTSWSSPVVVANTSQKYDGASIVGIGDGQVQIMYASDLRTANNYRGGDIYTKTRSVNGTWSNAKLIKTQDLPWALDVPNYMVNGHKDLRWIFAEKSKSVNFDGGDESNDNKAGYQRVYAYGDKGFVKRQNPLTITTNVTQISAGRAVGDLVAVINTENPRTTLSITSDPDSKFTLVGNELRLAATVTSGNTHSVTIRGVMRDKTTDATLTFSVIAADSLIDKQVGEWKLNEGSGRLAYDTSPRKLHGYLGINPITKGNEDLIWASYGLRSTNQRGQRVNIPYNSAVGCSKIHAFIAYYPEGQFAAKLLSRDSAWNGDRRSWQIVQDWGGKAKVVAYNSGGGNNGSYTTTAVVNTANQWLLLEVIINGTAVTIKKNGTVVETTTFGNTFYNQPRGDLVIGDVFDGGSYYSTRFGYVALYNDELSGADLTNAKAKAVAAMAAKGITITVA